MDDSGAVKKGFSNRKRCNKCNSVALKGKETCRWHTEGHINTKAEPGKPRSRRHFDITGNLTHMKLFVRDMIKQCKDGKILPSQLNSIVSACNCVVKIHEIEEVQKVLVEMKGEALRSRLREKLPEGADYIYQQGNLNPIEYESAVLDVEPEPSKRN